MSIVNVRFCCQSLTIKEPTASFWSCHWCLTIMLREISFSTYNSLSRPEGNAVTLHAEDVHVIHEHLNDVHETHDVQTQIRKVWESNQKKKYTPSVTMRDGILHLILQLIETKNKAGRKYRRFCFNLKHSPFEGNIQEFISSHTKLDFLLILAYILR